MANERETAFINLAMVDGTRDLGKMVVILDMEYVPGKMADATRENG